MRLLSSKECAHPNVVQLFTVYHSLTHVMFVMEDGGPENLYRRLCYRTHQKSNQRRPMALSVVKALIWQALTVVRHIHVVAEVCHRDIKSENFIVDDRKEEFVLKLADFDLAMAYQKDAKFRSPCGTVPFTAPEVLLDREYDGQMCDVWSLGVVLFEVLCGCRILEEVFSLDEVGSDQTAIAGRIRDGFSDPDSARRIIKQHYLTEVGPICEIMATTLSGMMNISIKQRWDAEQVLQHFTEASEKQE